MVYIREAHPQDGKQAAANVRDGILINDPKTLEERRKVAQDFVSQFHIQLPILVDELDDRAQKAFAAWPDRIYLLDSEAKVVYRSGPGPAGFKPDEVPPVMDKLLMGETPPLSPLPANLRLRLVRLSGEAFLSEDDQGKLLEVAQRRFTAVQALMQKRPSLMQSTETMEATKALAEWDAALATFQKEAEAGDKELDTLLGWKKDPVRRATLVGLGLLGAQPLPLPGMMPLGQRRGG